MLKKYPEYSERIMSLVDRMSYLENYFYNDDDTLINRRHKANFQETKKFI